MTSGTATILVVDDEPEVRSMIAEFLRDAGHQVLEASSGAEALAVSAEHPGTVDLLLTDLIMPGMTGRMLADTLCAKRPGTAVLFMSGHIAVSRQADLAAGVPYVQKPVDGDELERKVREIVEQKKR